MTPAEPSICALLARLTLYIAESSLPPRIVEEARLCLIDYLASVVAADQESLITEMAPIFGTGTARLLFDGRPIGEAGAVWMHGFMATVADIDDAHALASGMHLAATVLPTTLALAQSRNTSQARVIRAIVAGYEIGGRLVRSMDGGLRKQGFHATGALGPFAACAAAGVLLNLSEGELTHAFGIAASQGGGLFAFLPTGAGVRHTHAAHAGVAGLTAACAARAGVTGPQRAFEGPDGFVKPYAGEMDASFFDAPAPVRSEDFEITNAYHKRFAACGHAVPAITLALGLRPALLARLDQIRSIEVEGYHASATLTGWPVNTVGTAKFSIPAVVALALLHGDVSALEMQSEFLADPAVQSMGARVSVREDAALSAAFPHHRSGRMIVTLTDGEILHEQTDRPIGMPGNRLTLEQVIGKYRTLAEPCLGSARAEALLEVASGLADVSAPFQHG